MPCWKARITFRHHGGKAVRDHPNRAIHGAEQDSSLSENPYVTDPTWFKRACWSGKYSDVPPAPITPVWCSIWLMEKLYDYGYTQVDTVFYWDRRKIRRPERRSS